MSVIIKFRRGNSSEWISNGSTVLASGEPGFELDTGRFKIGNGITAWSGLYYASIVPTGFIAGSGIDIDLGTNGSYATISVTGGTNISNYGDNRLLTSDGTITGINGEGNLTFNGSLLSVTGSGNFVSGLFVNNIPVSISGHTHTVSQITDFNSGVSGLLPTVTGTGYVVSSFNNNTYTINVTGLQPSGNYSVVGHTHIASDITDFNSSVSGLLPVKNIVGGTGIYVTSTTGNYTIGISGNVLISGLNADLLDSQHGSYYLDWTNTTNKPSPIITGILTGDVAGTGSVTLSQLSNGTLTINSTIQPNSVALGTDTTGNYVSLVAVSGTGLSIAGSAGEDSTFTVVSNATPANSGGTIISRDSNGNFYATTGNLDVLYFNTNIQPTLLQGQMAWNDTEGTVDIALTDTTIINIGEHEMYRVRNTTGGILYKGQAVMASGVHANGIIIPNLYTANGSVREIRFMGLVYENINDNNNGYVIHFGHVNNIDTRGNVASNIAVGDETWADGDILYVHPTAAGKLTKNEPKHSIAAAIILDTASNGKIFVRPNSYGHLDDNHDVSVSGATNGQFLQYNSATDYWVPSSSGNFTTLLVNGTGVSISGHTHTASSITDFNEAVDDRIGSGLFVAGTGINLNYNDGSNSFTVSVTGLVNNPTNNRILTSRDSTTTGIDAESNLTFENKTLNIGSSGNPGPEAIINLYTNDSGDGKPGINFKDYDDNTKFKIYYDDNDNISYVYNLNDTLVLSGPTNYIGINNDGTIGIVSSGVTSNNNFGITNQTANTIASFDGSKNVVSLSTGTYPSLTELSYVRGVTSAIQTQINTKQNSLTNPVTGTGVANHIAYWNSSSGIIADSGQLYWDDTNNRLGIGTAAPASQLQVVGTGRFTNIDINNSAIAGTSALTVNGAISTQSQSVIAGQFAMYGDGNTVLHKANASTFAMSVSNSGYRHSFGWNSLGTHIPWAMISSSGVGIGTISPSYNLDVVGTGNFSQNLLVNGVSVSVSGHTHTSSDITNFNASVSGLLPTISNSGDNRILTSTGTSTGVNAESNLTFDGSLLNVSGNLNVSVTGDINTLKINNFYHQNLSVATGLADNDLLIAIIDPTGTATTEVIQGSVLRSSLLNQPAQLQFRQGTDAERLLITPASGEPIWTTDTQKFYIGDGTTIGGDFVGPSPYDRGTGTNSVVVSNSGCEAIGNNSVVLGGINNLARGARSFIGGGTNNVAALKARKANNIGTITNTITVLNATAADFDNTTANALKIFYNSGGSQLVTSRTVSSATQSGANVTVVLTSNVGAIFPNTWFNVAVVNTAETDSSIGQVINGNSNLCAGNSSTVCGGYKNASIGAGSTVGGGNSNINSSINGTVGGGYYNTSSGFYYSTVGGGRANTSSGNHSTVGGGYSNTSSGYGSTIGGGRYNQSAGIGSVIAGGGWYNPFTEVTEGNTTTADICTIGGGAANSATSIGSTVSGGKSNTSSGNYGTVSGGYNNTSSGNYGTIPGGIQAKATLYGELSHAAGRFAADGDAQHTILIARRTTTNATANQVLFLDESSALLTLPAETTWAFTVKLSAYNDTDNQGGWWIFRGGIRRNAANGTVLIGSLITESGVESSLSTASASVVADDTNEALEIRVTGVASKNIRWVAVVDISQVSYGTP